MTANDWIADRVANTSKRAKNLCTKCWRVKSSALRMRATRPHDTQAKNYSEN